MDELSYQSTTDLANTDAYASTYADIEKHRDDAMDALTDPYVTTVDLLSEEVDTLLDPQSEYMEQAKADSRKRGEEAGMLESGFLEGVGEVAAIDQVFDIAQGNIYNDMFNAQDANTKELKDYTVAFQNAYITQIDQDVNSLAQYQYGLDAQSQATEQQYQNYYQDLSSSYELDRVALDASLIKDYNDLLQQYVLEESEANWNYDSIKAAMDREYTAKAGEAQRDFRGVLVDQRVDMFWQDRALYGWMDIQTANMLPEEKGDALAGLYEMINSYSDTVNIPGVDKESPLYNWDQTDVDGWGGRVNDSFKTIQTSIEDQVEGFRGRESVPGYKDIKAFQYNWDKVDPEVQSNIMHWFVGTGNSLMTSENFHKAAYTMNKLIAELSGSNIYYPVESEGAEGDDYKEANNYRTFSYDKDTGKILQTSYEPYRKDDGTTGWTSSQKSVDYIEEARAPGDSVAV